MYISKGNCSIILDKNSERKNLFMIIKRQDMEAIKQQRYEKNNVCPHCHLVLPLNGECECGYIKSR